MSIVLCELADAARFGVPSLSPFCLKAHTALRIAGLPYERRHGARPDAFAKLNPTGQVPVLLDGERVIADSTPIVAWVAEQRPDRLAHSPEAWLWEELADGTLNGFLVASRWADDRNWMAVREAYFEGMPAVLKWIIPTLLRRRVLAALHARDIWRAGETACWARFSRLLDHLDARAPQTDFWCGPVPSVADVALYGQLRSLDTELTPWQSEQIRQRGRLMAWMARVEGSTATLRAVA